MILDYNKCAEFRRNVLTIISPPAKALECRTFATQLMEYAVAHEDELPKEITASASVSELAIYSTLEKVCNLDNAAITISTNGFNAPKICKLNI